MKWKGLMVDIDGVVEGEVVLKVESKGCGKRSK
jgi:hypothetical protein